ncbi:MAG: pyridoxal phosphate-dependent aminotransferase [Burkholderiaceae bacterium]|nr:pyridoxal phosphate-dependent aminotransferase [Burkholderiaceae bacterium]MCX7901235.1 pyridoxal phosphate-dependent aminotransferase [Burkholderiaceae bacterium]
MSVPIPAARVARIAPFYVMEIMKEAARLQAAGQSIVHLSIGEPDFTAPAPVLRAAEAALAAGQLQYTPAAGLPALRAAIAADYARVFGVALDPDRILVTAGASGALLLAFAALVERDVEVLMPDPTYPCNRHFVAAFEGRARLVPCGPAQRFQLDAAAVAGQWSPQTRGVLLASPSNPTGTTIAPATLAELIGQVRARGGFVVVDEIYQRLTYDAAPHTALSLSDEVFVVNSFSKYFNMTGWRLGWLVAPAWAVPLVEKLAQNFYICAPAPAQQAALACFSDEALAIYEARRAELRRRRDFLLPALQRLGFKVPVVPDGAFYVYADISRFSQDSWTFAFEVLRGAGVCLVPGRDFGDADTHRYVRISYAADQAQLEEALLRLQRFLA